uniref:Uncharacterized protein n=1 Tax=viral metagenome TaxID=1070528 RepID=A0A6C0JS88_9ZZZZ
MEWDPLYDYIVYAILALAMVFSIYSIYKCVTGKESFQIADGNCKKIHESIVDSYGKTYPYNPPGGYYKPANVGTLNMEEKPYTTLYEAKI